RRQPGRRARRPRHRPAGGHGRDAGCDGGPGGLVGGPLRSPPADAGGGVSARAPLRSNVLLGASLVILAMLGAVFGAGLMQSRKWSRDIWIEGLRPGAARQFTTPPYGLMTEVVAYHEDGTDEGLHLYVLGS